MWQSARCVTAGAGAYHAKARSQEARRVHSKHWIDSWFAVGYGTERTSVSAMVAPSVMKRLMALCADGLQVL
jgi:hypothetical protein